MIYIFVIELVFNRKILIIMGTDLDIIEVMSKDVRRANTILRQLNITFRFDNKNGFEINDMDEWNEAMEAFENNDINLL